MTTYKRYGNRWSINECLQLQREFELLKLSIDEIAERHQRTPNAIMFKLDKENIADYNVLYSNYNQLNSTLATQRKYDYESECETEEDCDNSSNYSEEEEDEEDLEEEDSYDGSYDAYNLKHHVMRLEKQINSLTEMMLQLSTNKPKFSFFN
jgi:hypothetical protein